MKINTISQRYMKNKTVSLYDSEGFYFNHRILYTVESKKFEIHEHDVYEIIFLVKGDVSYFIEGKTYRLKKYDVLIASPHMKHRMIIKDNDDYERYDILFDTSYLNGITKKVLENIPDVISVDGNENMLGIFKRMDIYCNSFEGKELYTLFSGLVKEMILNLSFIAKSAEQNITVTFDPLVNHAIEYIQKNLATLKNIDDICSELYISKSHLHHIFAKHLMISPKKYITAKRLLEAQKKLRNGSTPTEVYRECGFYDYASFFRNYKSYFGYSPSHEDNSDIKKEILS